MATLRKDVLQPGLYQKNQRLYSVTGSEVQAMHRSVPDLQGLGYRIAVWKEHPGLKDWRAYPIAESDKDKIQLAERDPWFAGWVKDSVLGSDDRLGLDFDTNDDLAERLKEVGTFVSPQYGRLKIGDRVFEKAIHHLALTRNPVNENQSNQFTAVEKTENPKSGIDGNPNISNVVQMSLTDAIAAGDTVSFSMTDAVMHQSNPTQPGANAGQQQPDHESDAISRFTEACSALGVQIDQSSPILKDPRLMSRLTGVLADMTGDAAQTATQQQQQSGASGAPGTSGLSQQSTVVAMSKTGTETSTATPPVVTPPTVTPPVVITDDTTVQMSRLNQALLIQDGKIKSQDGLINGLMQRVTEQSRAAYEGRIANLSATGRIAAADADALRALAGTFQFSATSPESKGELDIRLEIYEKLPANSIMPMTGNTPTQMSQNYSSTPVQSSAFFATTEPDEARAASILDELVPLKPR